MVIYNLSEYFIQKWFIYFYNNILGIQSGFPIMLLDVMILKLLIKWKFVMPTIQMKHLHSTVHRVIFIIKYLLVYSKVIII